MPPTIHMTTIIQTLKHVADRTRPAQDFFECRHCGTTVDGPGDTCPTCGSEEIACYQLG